MKKTVMYFGAALSVIALMSAAVNGFKEVSLEEKGIPVTVSAPEGAIIEEGVGHGMELDGVVSYVWEINAEGFSLEAAMEDDAMWQDKEDYVNDAREFVEMDEGFEAYEVEDENGFICRYNYDGDIEYDFYYILVKGDRAIEFTPGLALYDYTFANIRQLFYTAKAAK